MAIGMTLGNMPVFMSELPEKATYSFFGYYYWLVMLSHFCLIWQFISKYKKTQLIWVTRADL